MPAMKSPAAPRFEPAPPRVANDDTSNTVSEIRKRNLLWLRARFQEDRQRKFPDEPAAGMDKKFAERIGLNPKYYGHIKNDRRSVGNALARQVEEAFAMPVGWLDAAHSESAGKSEDENEVVSAILTIYREQPDEARRVVMRALQEHLSRKVAEGKGKRKEK
jgi:transcriptional regulator with XRE-family HTH domain